MKHEEPRCITDLKKQRLLHSPKTAEEACNTFSRDLRLLADIVAAAKKIISQ